MLRSGGANVWRTRAAFYLIGGILVGAWRTSRARREPPARSSRPFLPRLQLVITALGSGIVRISGLPAVSETRTDHVEEVHHLQFEAIAFLRQCLRRREHLRGSRSGLVRVVADVAAAAASAAFFFEAASFSAFAFAFSADCLR